MRFLVLSALLATVCAAHAAPTADGSDNNTEQILQAIALDPAPAPVASPLAQVRQSVTDRTSELVVRAISFIGVPYRRGGTSAETGFDCSGLVRSVYDQTLGHLLPRRAEEQAHATEKIDRDELRPGDLVFFNTMRRTFSHVGIYIGDGKFIHAPRTGAHVRVESLNVNYWQRRFNGARRVLSSENER